MTDREPRRTGNSASPRLPASLSFLPDESPQEYEQGLAGALEELQASTPLQRYLAQKIFDCLWWMRRYERLRITTLTVAMARCAAPPSRADGLTEAQARIVHALRSGDWEDAYLNQSLASCGHTPQTLVLKASEQVSDKLAKLDQQIALRMKTLSGLQSAYENLFNRHLHAERLRLQTEFMKRELSAIDTPMVEAIPTRAAPSSDARNRHRKKATG